MRTPSLFVTGTDTGVGKTVATALLACRLRSLGIDAGVMKPFATGCKVVGGRLENEDVRFLREATGVEDEDELLAPARWEEPLAPLAAARRAGNASLPWSRVCREAFEELRARHECVIVEGVGGWLVPLHEGPAGIVTVANFAEDLGSPVVVVARRVLGTISHSLLTLSSVGQVCAPAGLVFCDAAPVEEDVASETGPALVSEISGVPIWAQIPFVASLSPGQVRELAGSIEWRLPDWG
jgi:dethiobiotin synthetase